MSAPSNHASVLPNATYGGMGSGYPIVSVQALHWSNEGRRAMEGDLPGQTRDLPPLPPSTPRRRYRHEAAKRRVRARVDETPAWQQVIEHPEWQPLGRQGDIPHMGEARVILHPQQRSQNQPELLVVDEAAFADSIIQAAMERQRNRPTSQPGLLWEPFAYPGRPLGLMVVDEAAFVDISWPPPHLLPREERTPQEQRERDVELIISQTGVSIQEALAALERNENDVVNAIMDLTVERS